MNRRLESLCALAVLALLPSLLSCQRDPGPAHVEKGTSRRETTRWFPEVEPDALSEMNGVYFVKGLNGYQQTTDYTCGPAALLVLSQYYQKGGVSADQATEMRIAKEAGTRSMEVLKAGGKPGTSPDEMKAWLESHGLDVRLDYEDKGDGSALARLKENAIKGIPTLVEWADLGGHWVIVVGYDTRDNDDPWDDVLIFADSFDRYDDCQDGYSYANANRFYWLWYDAFCFDKLTWRTMITATPRGKSPVDEKP